MFVRHATVRVTVWEPALPNVCDGFCALEPKLHAHAVTPTLSVLWSVNEHVALLPQEYANAADGAVAVGLVRHRAGR